MAFEIAEIKELEQHFDERYVKQKDCDDKQEAVNKKFANDDKRIEIIIQKFNIIEKLMWAIATASIGSLIATFWDMITK